MPLHKSTHWLGALVVWLYFDLFYKTKGLFGHRKLLMVWFCRRGLLDWSYGEKQDFWKRSGRIGNWRSHWSLIVRDKVNHLGEVITDPWKIELVAKAVGCLFPVSTSGFRWYFQREALSEDLFKLICNKNMKKISYYRRTKFRYRTKIGHPNRL